MTVKDFISDVTPISLFEFVIDVPAGKFEDDEIGAYLEIIEVFDLILDSWLTSDGATPPTTGDYCLFKFVSSFKIELKFWVFTFDNFGY